MALRESSTIQLAVHGMRVGRLTYQSFGEAMGMSSRTVQRWVAAGSGFGGKELAFIAKQAFPYDPELAAALAERAGETLESLGLVAPAPAPAPPPPAPPVPKHLVDVVVCAVAESLDVSPRTVRPPLLVAFRRARELGLTVDFVESALASPGEAGAPRSRKKP